MSDTGASLPEQPGSSPSSSFTAFRCGLLHAVGGFDANDLSGEERAGITEKKSWFFTGEALMASLMAATIAIPAGSWFAGRTELPLAFIGAGVLFLPLFIFLRVHQDLKDKKNAKPFFDSCPGSSGTP